MNIKKIYLVCSKFFYKNLIFDIKNPVNRDNCLYLYYLLKQKFRENGFDLNTYDYFNKNAPEDYALLFLDSPKNINYYLKNHPGAKKFLIAYESPIKNTENQKAENHRYFEKIFTWNDALADNLKYFRLSYAQKIPKNSSFDINKKTKLCAAIFGHKLQTAPKELYSERIKAIRWFEKNNPEDFDLYGQGWNEHYFKDKLFHLNRIKFLKKLMIKPNFPSYKGYSKEKKETYKNYKFAICYENASFDSYITEKIFDCFFGGCVPIYLGAPNIADYIPENTFIDKRKFPTYEGLYLFIKNMPDNQYERYLEDIKNFLESDKIYPFSAEFFAATISKEIIKSIY